MAQPGHAPRSRGSRALASDAAHATVGGARDQWHRGLAQVAAPRQGTLRESRSPVCHCFWARAKLSRLVRDHVVIGRLGIGDSGAGGSRVESFAKIVSLSEGGTRLLRNSAVYTHLFCILYSFGLIICIGFIVKLMTLRSERHPHIQFEIF